MYNRYQLLVLMEAPFTNAFVMTSCSSTVIADNSCQCLNNVRPSYVGHWRWPKCTLMAHLVFLFCCQWFCTQLFWLLQCHPTYCPYYQWQNTPQQNGWSPSICDIKIETHKVNKATSTTKDPNDNCQNIWHAKTDNATNLQLLVTQRKSTIFKKWIFYVTLSP